MRRKELNSWANSGDAGQLVEMRALNVGHGEEAPSILTWEQAIRVLQKHRWLLAGLAGGLTLATVLVTLWLPDVYRPTARLQIDPVEGGITTLHEIENAKSEADQDYLDTQVQILQSEGLAMRVIRALHLERNAEFAGLRPRNDSEPSKSDSSASFAVTDGNSYLQEQLELAQATPAEAEALQKFHRKLLVSPVRGSRVVEVSFASHDRKVAQTVTNTLVTQYMHQNYQNRYATTMEASGWLSSQLGDLRRRVAQTNQAVSDYQKRYGLVEVDEKDVPLGQLMGEVSKQLSDAQADRIQAEAGVRLIAAGQTDALPSFRDDTVYQTLVTHLADVRGQLAEAQAVYGDENANVKKLKGQIEELAAQVDAERGRLIKRAFSTFEAAKSREQMMVAERAKLHTQMGDASSHLVEYGMLKNEAVANATLYNTLQARLREAGIYAALPSGNIRVVDMAPILQKPTGPLRGIIIGLGMVLSLILGLTAVFVRESFDNTVRIPDDIKNWTSLPSLAVLPTVAAKQNPKMLRGYESALSAQPALESGTRDSNPMVFWARAQTAEAEAVRTLRAALLTPDSTITPQVILVASPSVGEGKTTVALNLASVLAQHGKTCLIEGDMRRPTIHTAFNLSPITGLGEVLEGRASITDALIPVPNTAGLMLLPTKELPNSPSDLLTSEMMKRTLIGLREQFEHVVIDSAPLLSFSDARTLAWMSDAVILVSRYGRTTRRALLRSVELLAEAQAPLLGVVLNDMDISSPDFHYFNYGYSWANSGRKYQQVYEPFAPGNSMDPNDGKKSRGAHA